MNKQDIKVLFNTHKGTDQFFITNDNQAFFTAEMADSHGQRLTDRTVTVISRDSLNVVDDATKTVEDIVTGQISKAVNPELAEGSVQTVAPPAPPVTPPAPVKTLLQIAQETPEAERTGHQKGLITKELNRLAKGSEEAK